MGWGRIRSLSGGWAGTPRPPRRGGAPRSVPGAEHMSRFPDAAFPGEVLGTRCVVCAFAPWPRTRRVTLDIEFTLEGGMSPQRHLRTLACFSWDSNLP